MNASQRFPTMMSLALLVSLAGTAPACSQGEPTPRGVLIISIDATRPDHLSCYGYDRPTTPAIDAIARDGIRFERCYAQSNWTKPAIASMFTGLYVRHHGVTVGYWLVDGTAAEGDPAPAKRKLDRKRESYPLPADIPVMAESFRAHGFRTGGFVENPHLVAAQGFGRGFDEYRRQQGAIALLRRWIGELPPASRFFAFIHLIGPHDPYDDDGADFAKYRDRFGTHGSTIDFKGLAYKKRRDLGEQDIRQATALYDAKLAFVDAEQIAPLIDDLKKAGLYDELLIVITSDHGEELYDHGRFSHGLTLYEEVIRVPLVVKLPKSMPALAPGSTVTDLVEIIDLFPTLADVVGFAPPAALDGDSLASLLLGRQDGHGDDFAISEYASSVPNRVLGAAVIAGDHKLIESYHRGPLPAPTLDDGRERVLFHLESDPREKRDLGGERLEVVRALQALLERQLGKDVAVTRQLPAAVKVSPQEQADLEALGYAGGGR